MFRIQISLLYQLKHTIILSLLLYSLTHRPAAVSCLSGCHHHVCAVGTKAAELSGSSASRTAGGGKLRTG